MAIGMTPLARPEGFGFIDFDGVGLKFGGLEPFFGFLPFGVVEIDSALLLIGEQLAVGRPDGRDNALGIGLLQKIGERYRFFRRCLSEEGCKGKNEQDDDANAHIASV